MEIDELDILTNDNNLYVFLSASLPFLNGSFTPTVCSFKPMASDIGVKGGNNFTR